MENINVDKIADDARMAQVDEKGEEQKEMVVD